MCGGGISEEGNYSTSWMEVSVLLPGAVYLEQRREGGGRGDENLAQLQVRAEDAMLERVAYVHPHANFRQKM